MSDSDFQKAVVVNDPGVRWIVAPGPRNGDSDWFKATVIDPVPEKGRRGPPKHFYRLSHNRERFARCKEFKLLAERFPEAVPVIEAAMFGESRAGNSNAGDRP